MLRAGSHRLHEGDLHLEERAHALQQCNNFKDPGVQHYGGALFQGKLVQSINQSIHPSIKTQA